MMMWTFCKPKVIYEANNIQLLSHRTQGVDIIIFPEYGLTGTGLSELPYAEFQEYCQIIHQPDYNKDISEMVSGLL